MKVIAKVTAASARAAGKGNSEESDDDVSDDDDSFDEEDFGRPGMQFNRYLEISPNLQTKHVPKQIMFRI